MRAVSCAFRLPCSPSASRLLQFAACAPKDFDSAKFTVCTFDPRHDDIRLLLSGPDDKPYGSLGALASALKQKGERLAFAMNAGMFGQDQSPVALRGRPT